MEINKHQVTAENRKLNARFTLECFEDFVDMHMHGESKNIRLFKKQILDLKPILDLMRSSAKKMLIIEAVAESYDVPIGLIGAMLEGVWNE